MCVVYGMVSVTHKPFQNRNIEYCDFHFSCVLFSTKMAHLRRLGIHRFHFSITISFGCFLHPFFPDSCISFRISASPLYYFFAVFLCRCMTLFNWTPPPLQTYLNPPWQNYYPHTYIQMRISLGTQFYQTELKKIRLFWILSDDLHCKANKSIFTT